MFESADLDYAADKARWAKEEPELRQALLQAQFELGTSQACAVLVIIAGVDGAGKGEMLHLLNEWMDPRHIHSYGFAEPSDEEDERPAMWRFWRVLPPRGKIGIFFGSWYTAPIVARALGDADDSRFETELALIRRHEQMLADEGVLLVKLWFHLSKEQQRRRLKTLEKDPDTRWRVTREDWRRFKNYDRFREVSAQALRVTSTGPAPWMVIPGADPRYRSLAAGRVLLDAMQARLAAVKERRQSRKPASVAATAVTGELLNRLDLGLRLSKGRYEKQLEKWQGQLNLLSRSKRFREHSLVAVFEGGDAAGKGSAIRRVSAALDARYYKITPVAAPTEEEREQPFLWRFWRHLPRQGHTAIFDRSWYGRVLVERVEGFCSPVDWMRGYTEINDFEAQLAADGAVVCKFWLHISAEEQLRRFKEREATPFKRFKITPDDWRNREQRAAYDHAVCDMIDRCSTELAPWTLVEAEDKYYARIKILKTLVERLDCALD